MKLPDVMRMLCKEHGIDGDHREADIHAQSMCPPGTRDMEITEEEMPAVREIFLKVLREIQADPAGNTRRVMKELQSN